MAWAAGSSPRLGIKGVSKHWTHSATCLMLPSLWGTCLGHILTVIKASGGRTASNLCGANVRAELGHERPRHNATTQRATTWAGWGGTGTHSVDLQVINATEVQLSIS